MVFLFYWFRMSAPVPSRNRERRVRIDYKIDEEYVEGLRERQAIINRYFGVDQ